MAEPRQVGKTRAQIDAQMGRILSAVDEANRTALDRARTPLGQSGAVLQEVPWEEIRRNQRRWFTATTAYGNMTKDNQLIGRFTDYRPEDEFFTSADDIRKVDKHFKLSKRTTESLMALRNNVVKYYDDNYRGGEQRWQMMPWMQSITAVIDEYIRRKGGQV